MAAARQAPPGYGPPGNVDRADRRRHDNGQEVTGPVSGSKKNHRHGDRIRDPNFQG